MNKEKAITLISLIITIIVLLILSGVIINSIMGDTGIFFKTQEAVSETNKQAATEMMNVKITSAQIAYYAQNQTLASLQYLADKLCEDNDIEYVLTESKKQSSLTKIDLKDKVSIFTKLKKYPYEFEINSNLQLASIDGISLANSNESELQRLRNENAELKSQIANLRENNGSSFISVENEIISTWISKINTVDINEFDDLFDNKLLTTLMTTREAVNYMLETPILLDAVLANENAFTELAKSDYAAYKVLINDVARTKLFASSYMSIFNKYANKISTLSNNTNTIYSSNYSDSYTAYMAFDNNESTSWCCKKGDFTGYIGYDYGDNNVFVYGMSILNCSTDDSFAEAFKTAVVKRYSTDINDYVPVSDTLSIDAQYSSLQYFYFTPQTSSKWILNGITSHGGNYIACRKLQFYSRNIVE